MDSDLQNWFIFGATGGLGSAFSSILGVSGLSQRQSANSQCQDANGIVDGVGERVPQVILSSRKRSKAQGLIDQLKAELPNEGHLIQWIPYEFDVTSADLDQALHEIKTHRITHVIYFPGGGPYGDFAAKAWKDHVWSFKVGLLFPLQLAHALMQPEFDFIEQLVFVGSSVAEDGDPYASSYAAGKAALAAWFHSVVAEKPRIDLRLFSPGYMDTPLLPPNAFPRQREGGILSPLPVAETLFRWLREGDRCTHLRYPLQTP